MILLHKQKLTKHILIAILSISSLSLVLLSLPQAEAKVFLGTSGDDSIVGTTKDDVMIGKEGDDTLNGGDDPSGERLSVYDLLFLYPVKIPTGYNY